MRHRAHKKIPRKKLILRPARLKPNRGSWGVSLPELLATLVIALFLISLTFGVFNTVSGMIKKAEIQTERRIDLNRAFDFMTQEIRSAVRVNQTAGVAGASLDAVIAAATGKTPPELGMGTPVLYLEVPFSGSGNTCAATGPDYDPVIYDIRSNSTTPHWLGPRVITRYGRIPGPDGRVSACRADDPTQKNDPVNGDVLVDNMMDIGANPNCPSPAVRTGAGGFYACVENGLVKLTLRSQVVDLQTQKIDSSALSRPAAQGLAPVLTAMPSGTAMQLNWTWPGTSTGVTFKVFRTTGSTRTEIATNVTGNTYTDTATVTGARYTVVAVSGSYTSDESNAVP